MARFYRRGKTRVFFVPTIAHASKAPTVAEVTAGTELTGSINDMNGFTWSATKIDTPDMSSTFTSNIGGPDEVEDSSLTIYLDSSSNPLRSTLAKGTAGYIVIADHKPSGALAAADVVDVWPIEVLGRPKMYDLGDAPALWSANLSTTATPAEDVAVLA